MEQAGGGGGGDPRRLTWAAMWAGKGAERRDDVADAQIDTSKELRQHMGSAHAFAR